MPAELRTLLEGEELPEGPVWAQAFHVQDIVGRGAPLRDELGPGFEALFVPWDFGAGCEPLHWTESAKWSESQREGVYLAWLRPRGEWTQGRPTFDVAYAGEQPYDVPSSSDAEWLGSYLSTAEFFSVCRLLTEASDSLTAVGAFRQWLAEHPEAERKYPIIYMRGWR